MAYSSELMHSRNNNFLELLSPNGIKLINFLVLRNGELGQVSDKALGCLCIFLGLKSVVLYLKLPVLLRLITMGLLLDLRRKDSWC